MSTGRPSSGASAPRSFGYLHRQVLRSVYLAETSTTPVTLARLEFRLRNGGCVIAGGEIGNLVDELEAAGLLLRDGDTVSAPS